MVCNLDRRGIAQPRIAILGRTTFSGRMTLTRPRLAKDAIVFVWLRRREGFRPLSSG